MVESVPQRDRVIGDREATVPDGTESAEPRILDDNANTRVVGIRAGTTRRARDSHVSDQPHRRPSLVLKASQVLCILLHIGPI